MSHLEELSWRLGMSLSDGTLVEQTQDPGLGLQPSKEGEIGGKKNRQCLQMTEVVVLGCVMPGAIGMLDYKEMRTSVELCISLG